MPDSLENANAMSRTGKIVAIVHVRYICCTQTCMALPSWHDNPTTVLYLPVFRINFIPSVLKIHYLKLESHVDRLRACFGALSALSLQEKRCLSGDVGSCSLRAVASLRSGADGRRACEEEQRLYSRACCKNNAKPKFCLWTFVYLNSGYIKITKNDGVRSHLMGRSYNQTVWLVAVSWHFSC